MSSIFAREDTPSQPRYAEVSVNQASGFIEEYHAYQVWEKWMAFIRDYYGAHAVMVYLETQSDDGNHEIHVVNVVDARGHRLNPDLSLPAWENVLARYRTYRSKEVEAFTFYCQARVTDWQSEMEFGIMKDLVSDIFGYPDEPISTSHHIDYPPQREFTALYARVS